MKGQFCGKIEEVKMSSPRIRCPRIRCPSITCLKIKCPRSRCPTMKCLEIKCPGFLAGLRVRRTLIDSFSLIKGIFS